MRFFADMGVAPSVVVWRRQIGHDADHVRERLPTDSDDNTILDLAVIEDRIVLSMDHDFGTLYFMRRLTRPSLVFFRVTDARPASVMVRLGQLLATAQGELEVGCIATVDDRGARIRSLPVP